MAHCPGAKGKQKCYATVYKCRKCQSVGCDQQKDNVCTNQTFKLSKCMKCGAHNQKEPVK